MSQRFTSGPFALTVLAETGERFADFAPYVASINAAGVVAFQAALRAGGTGVFTCDGAEPPRSALGGNEPALHFISHPDIDARGALSVYAELPGGASAVVGIEDGVVHVLASAGELWRGIGPLGPTMNEAGAVAFRGDLATGNHAIARADRDGVTVIAQTGAELRAFHGLPLVNATGEVAFRADLADGTAAICLGRGGTVTNLVEARGVFRDLALFPSCDDAGRAAFGGVLVDGRAGIYVACPYGIAPFGRTEGAFESVRNALITNDGVAAYAATPPGGALGIYAGPDPAQDRVLALGQTVLGAEVAGFALNPVSVNERGQIAIRLALADGRQFILRAERG